MLGQAALAMWWTIAPEWREEFEHWHSHEHFAERLALPGFLRATRWADSGGGDGFFVLYELAQHEALHSPEYLARLNAPSEWSRKMMPHHRGMVRCQTRVVASQGSAVSAHALTVRLAPLAGMENALLGHLEALVRTLPHEPGLAGAHLLRTDAPAIAPTAEQALRGHEDRSADWILIVNGYERDALRQVESSPLSHATLTTAGANSSLLAGTYELRLSEASRNIRTS